jgi:hypothetical protein
MLDPVDNYQALFHELMLDVEAARDALAASDTQFNRRSYVRTALALIEGETYLRKQYALMLHELRSVKLTDAEVVLLKEEQYRLNNKGEPDSQSLFLKLPDNLRFSFRIDAKVHGREYKLETGGQGWESFKMALAVRHRITHPKQFEDFEISDKEVTHVNSTLEWYLQNRKPS